MTTTNNYTHSCNRCGGIQNIDSPDIFSEQEIMEFLDGIFYGRIYKRKLSLDVYLKTARHLTEGVYKGFGKELINTTLYTPDEVMLSSLRSNVYIFSAAKNYQQTRAISALLTDKNGLVSFAEFEKKARELFTTYNKNYLAVEYQSAIMQARSASQWMDIQNDKSVYNLLEYNTVGDGRVRPEHRVLNGIVRPVDDKFWSTFMPPNGWNCRCTVVQRMDIAITPLNRGNRPSKDDVPEIFRFNPGIDKIIYSKKHPYFDVARGDKQFAKDNFGLPII